MPRSPKCQHAPRGRMAWPTGTPERHQPHASTYVCDRDECREDAAQWVEHITGTRGQFVPFNRPVQPAQPALFAVEEA